MLCIKYCGTVFIWLWIAPMPPPEYNILMHQFNFNKEAVIQPSINHNLYHSLTGGRDYPGIIELDYIGFCEHNNIIWVQGSTLTRKIYKKYCPLQAIFSMTQDILDISTWIQSAAAALFSISQHHEPGLWLQKLPAS